MSECDEEHIATLSVTKHSEDYRKPPKRFSISYRESANDGVLIAFAICIDKLTSRLNITEEEVSDCLSVYVLVEVSLCIVDELNHSLIGSRVELQGCNVGGLQVVSLEEHDVNVLSVSERSFESYRESTYALSVTVRRA